MVGPRLNRTTDAAAADSAPSVIALDRPAAPSAARIAAGGSPATPTGAAVACSVLFAPGADARPDETDFFVDLNLDQVVARITKGREEYDLAPFLHTPLHDVDHIRWRHEVLRDLEHPALLRSVGTFAERMRSMRWRLTGARTLHSELQKQCWFLDAVRLYCDAVHDLGPALSATTVTSRGFCTLRDHVSGYVASERFTAVVERRRRLERALAGIRYEVLIHELDVRVRRYAGAPDYSHDVEATFAKFTPDGAMDRTSRFTERAEVNHVEAKILEGIATLFPDVFAELAAFCAAHGDYQDPTIVTFDREVQLYVAVLAAKARLEQAGLPLCLPTVVDEPKGVHVEQSFDLALAFKLVDEGRPVVRNDVHLDGVERMIVVTGPNQGGKTTFARMFGQLHYLAALGMPVPGTRARLFLCDRVFAHFEREERPMDLRGKLQDDLVRIHGILERATSQSVLVLNEIFTSTTSRDAALLSRRIAATILALDALCVWVTFIDELASLDARTVSMIATIASDDPAARTYEVVRAPADGRAYALAIAERYGLTPARIRERIRG